MDRIIVAAKGETPTIREFVSQHIVVHHFEICDTMTIAQLAVLLDAVHGIAPKYKAYEKNCYWYASTISEVIRAKFGFSAENTENLGKKGSYGSINLGKTDTVAQAIAAYDSLWNSEHSQAEVRFLLCT